MKRLTVWRKLGTNLRIQLIKSITSMDYALVASILGIKVAIIIFGGLSYQIFLDQPLPGFSDWLLLWNRWDGPRYLSIAEYGYQPAGEGRLNLAFYPLFPLLIRLCSHLTHSYFFSAILISGVAAIAAGICLQKLLQLDYSRSVVNNTIWFFLIFPTSYFLHIGYTESLFLALTLGCLLAARHQQWRWAGILGAFATMTRINGMILLPTLFVEALHQYLQTRRLQKAWLWIIIVPAGFLVYLLCNAWVTGNPWTFLIVQREFWHKSFTWPWLSIQAKIGETLTYSPAKQQMVGIQELQFLLLGLYCTCWSWLKLRPAYSVWMTGNWLLFTSTSFILSTPRYSLVLFPLFILLAQLAKNRFWFTLASVWSLLLLAVFASLFIQGRWAF